LLPRSTLFPYTTLFRSCSTITPLLARSVFPRRSLRRPCLPFPRGRKRRCAASIYVLAIAPVSTSFFLRQRWPVIRRTWTTPTPRSEEHTSELQSRFDLV